MPLDSVSVTSSLIRIIEYRPIFVGFLVQLLALDGLFADRDIATAEQAAPTVEFEERVSREGKSGFTAGQR